MADALIVEDDRHFAVALSELVQQVGYRASTTATLAEARVRLHLGVPDVVLVDLILPDGNGIELVSEIETLASHTRVLIITGHRDVDMAIAALRAGVADFLMKPLDVDQLRAQLETIRQEAAAADIAASTPKITDGVGALVGASDAMQEIYRLIAKVSPTDMTVFLHGESGTGKELVASAIHQHSARCDKPFLAINCGAVPPNLIASELFGHERGSFTDANSRHLGYFERAHGGTLFLDEITEMPLDLQVQLLRVLENQTLSRIGGSEDIRVDVRIIAATNQHPREAVADGRMREDLLFRLMVFPMNLPPLRQRYGDIPTLATHFLNKLNETHSASKHLSAGALAFLEGYHWPGNVRELQNALQHAFILAPDTIEAEHFRSGWGEEVFQDGVALHCAPGAPMEDFERRFILATLEHYNGNKRMAAETLGISLKTLYNRLNQYRP